jgi:hypothetical protein
MHYLHCLCRLGPRQSQQAYFRAEPDRVNFEFRHPEMLFPRSAVIGGHRPHLHLYPVWPQILLVQSQACSEVCLVGFDTPQWLSADAHITSQHLPPMSQEEMQLTDDVEACVRLQRLPMNSGSNLDVNHWGVPLPGRRKADLLETRPETVIRRSHPGTSAPEGRLAGHKSGHGHFPQTR